MADISLNESDEVTIADAAGVNKLVVNLDGSINIAGIVSNIPAANTISTYTSQGKVFTLSGAISAATSGVNNPIFLIKNPSGSGKTLYLYRVIMACSINNVSVKFGIYYNPTITTNGTAATPRNNLIGSAVTAVATASSLPSLSATGTLLSTLQTGQNSNSIDFMGDFSIQILANNNIVITADPSSNGREVSMTIVWAEV